MKDATGLTFTTRVRFQAERTGRKRLMAGSDEAAASVEPGTVPLVARVLALAHRFETLLRTGVVRDYAELARIAGVSRPRITQITELLLLAPDIQEAVLDLPRTVHGRDRVRERDLRGVAAEPCWARQRTTWRALRS